MKLCDFAAGVEDYRIMIMIIVVVAVIIIIVIVIIIIIIIIIIITVKFKWFAESWYDTYRICWRIRRVKKKKKVSKLPFVYCASIRDQRPIVGGMRHLARS